MKTTPAKRIDAAHARATRAAYAAEVDFAIAAGLDTASSASRQHWIDTGEFLPYAPATPTTTPADTTTTTTTPRPLHEIAAEVRANWPKVYFGAVPYLRAMAELDTVADYYGADDTRVIVAYFLSNATTWKGDVARRVKAELKGLIGRK